MGIRTSYTTQSPKAVEGMPHGGSPHESRPLQLAQRKQVLRLTVAQGAATDDLVITIEDDETGQSYEATATGNANEATLAASAVAAIRASEIDKVFSAAATQATSGQDIILDFTARHGNRSYSGSSTGGTGASTWSETTAPGNTGLAFGRMVARGSGDDEFVALGASSELADIAGILVRTDANHLNDRGSGDNVCLVGVHYPINQRRRVWVKPEEAVAPGDPVFVRRALTSSAGRLGGFRASPAGSTQVATMTVTANGGLYGFAFGYDGVDYIVEFPDVDGTTTTDDAIDGLETEAALRVPAGVTASSASAAATMTITAAAGTEFDYVRPIGPATSVSVAASDVDAIDISSIASWESSADADGFALLFVDMK